MGEACAMAIDITCTQCKKLLRLNEKLAGKRIKCPSCQTVLQVPAASSASSPKQPAELWHLKTEDEQYHGPMARPELDRWVAEGRLTMNCQVLRDGADQWQWADEVYPQLAGGGPAAPAPTPTAAPTPAPTPAPPSPTPEKSSPGKPVSPSSSSSKATGKQKSNSGIPTNPPAMPASETPSNADIMWGNASGEMSSEMFGGMSGELSASSGDLAAETQSGQDSSTFQFGAPETAADSLSGIGQAGGLAGGQAGGQGGGDGDGGESPGFSFAPKKGVKTGKGKKAAKASAIGTKSSSVSAPAEADGELSDRSRLTAGLLGLFLGTVGMHRIYLGYVPLGLIMFATFGGCGIWSLIDAIMILTGKVPDAQGRRLRG
jgi:phage FluMu protein Com